MTIEIKVRGKALRMLRRGGTLKKATVRATKKAAATSARDMTSEAVKIVRETKGLKVKAIKKAIRIKKNRARRLDDMEWGVTAKATKTRLTDYSKVRPTKKGVMAEVNKGQPQLYKGAFLATMRSGHKGAFNRKGKARLPVEEIYAASPRGSLNNAIAIARLQRRGEKSFKKTFKRVFPTEIAKV